MWGALSDERMDLSFTIVDGLTNAVILGSEAHGTRGHILPSQTLDFLFRRLLRLAGLRWRYSTPPPHGLRLQSTSNPLKVVFRVLTRERLVVQLSPNHLAVD
jgi:hypothetical protein